MIFKKTRNLETLIKILVLSSGPLATLAVNPFTGLDPINLPKMLVISTIGFALLPILFLNVANFRNVSKLGLVLLVVFCISLVIVPVFTMPSLESQFWGAFGRSTGALTYFSYILILLSVSISIGVRRLSVNDLLNVFEKTSLFITTYVIIQFAGLDPIPWSQNLPFATLGNINFMSAFLGLANSLFFSKLVNEKLNISTKLFYLSILLLNSLLIWFTGSIQGLAILAVSSTAILLIFFVKRKLFGLALIHVFLTVIVGGFVSLGSAGLGPLGKFLYQETVIFRIDYWKAGVAMFTSNPFSGLGIDGYGEFYREYRDYAAAVRTGPARVSNTAHNVFIDLLAGGGIFLGFTFVGILSLGIILSLKSTLKERDIANGAHLLGLNLGFFVFCLISIGQIGVVIWGILFCGASIVTTSNSGRPPKVLKLDSKKNRDLTNRTQVTAIKDTKTLIALVSVLLFSVLGFLMSFIPNKADSNFLSALRAENRVEIERTLNSNGVTDFHHEKYLQFLLDQADYQNALRLAKAIRLEYPRSYFALTSILYLSNAPESEKVEAAKALRQIDPNNLLLQQDIHDVLGNN